MMMMMMMMMVDIIIQTPNPISLDYMIQNAPYNSHQQSPSVEAPQA